MGLEIVPRADHAARRSERLLCAQIQSITESQKHSLTACLKAHTISPSTLPRTHCVDQAGPDFTEVFLLQAPQWLGLREHTTAQIELYMLRHHLAM